MKLFLFRFCAIVFCVLFFASALKAQDEYQMFFFRVQEVSCNDKLCNILIAAGKNIGINENTTGMVVGRATTEQPKHEGVIAEKAVFLKEVDKDNLIFQATLSKAEKVIVGDVFACKVLVKKNRPQNVFFNLVKNGIIFQSVNEKDYYNYYDATTSITSAKEKVIIDSMVADIKYVGKYYSKDKANFPIIEKGKYKGKNVLDVMLAANSAEVYNFLRFVEENNTPYLANTWKISETYATWLVNGAVTPLKPEELKKQIIAANNETEIKAIIAENKITAELLAEIDAEADKLNEARKHSEAAKIVNTIIFIAKEKKLLETLAEAYWTKAAIESNTYNWEQVAIAYEAAAQTYMLDENSLMASISLNNLGDTYNELGNYDKAEGILKRAFKMQTDFLAKTNKENVKTVMQPYVGLTLRNLGDSYFNMSKFQDALNSYQQAVGYFEKVTESDQKNLGRKANTYSRIAKTYNKLGNTQKRNETLQEAIKIGEKLESKVFLAEIYKITAGMYSDSREYANARVYYEKTLETYQKLGNKGEQVYALANLANMVSLLENNFAKAEQLVGQALKLAQEVKDEHAISFCYRRIGDFQLNKGNPQKAQESYEKALEFSRKIQDKSDETSALLSLSGVYVTRGNFAKAKETCEQVIKIAQSNQDKISEQIAISSMGWLSMVSGNFTKAKEYYDQALTISKKIDNIWGISGIYGDLANLYTSLGDYKKAQDYLKQSDSIYKKLEARESLINNKMIAGRLAYYQGDYSKSLQAFQEASEEMKAIGLYNENLCISLGNQVDVLVEQKKYTEAEKIANESYQMAVKIQSARSKAIGKKLIGMAQTGLKKFADAEKNLLEAYNQSKQLNLLTIMLAAKNAQSVLYAEMKQNAKLEQACKEVIQISEQTGDNLYLWEAYYRLGVMHREKKDLEKAKEFLKKSVEVLEKIRNSVTGGEEAKKIFAGNENKLKVYGTLIDVLFEKDEIEEALSFMQQYNLAEMSDKMKNMDIKYQNKQKQANKERSLEVKTDILAKKQELQEQLKKDTKEQDKQKIESLKKVITIKEEEYLNFVQDEGDLSSYQKQLANLRKKKKDIPDNMAVISYFIGKSDLYVIVATKENITGRKVKLNKNDLDEIITVLRNQITVKKQGVRGKNLDLNKSKEIRQETAKDTLQKDMFSQYAERAYMYLVNPVHQEIKDKEILAIIPSGQLYLLPFQMIGKTLKDGTFSPLIEQYAIFYTNLGDVFDNLKEENTNKTPQIAAFGNPDGSLSSAEKEVKNIKNIYPQTKTFIRNEATEDKIKNLPTNFSVLHFATHGVLDYDEPKNSYLVMAKSGGSDGRFQIKELFGQDLMDNLNLVVLSACQTAVIDKKTENHNDPVSPASAFINQGVKSVIATLWNVDDDATAILMENFYKNIKTMNLTDALRKAQVDLSKNPKYNSPYFWSPFILIGNWR